MCRHRLVNHLSKGASPSGTCKGSKGEGTLITLSSSAATALHCSRIRAHPSTVRSSTCSADSSPTFGGRWPVLLEWGPLWHATASAALSTGSSGVLNPEYWRVGGRSSARGWRLGADGAVFFWMALVSSSTRLSIAFLSFITDFPRSLSSRRAWNVAQSIPVKLRRSIRFLESWSAVAAD
jgi:hypothetical protein